MLRPLVVLLALAGLARADTDPPGKLGDALGRFQFTFYWVAEESEFRARPQTYLFDSACLPVASVSVKYLRQLAMEGTGVLTDGRLLNFDGRCLCSRWEGVACFREVRDERRWGIGVDDRPLVPFRSVAVDNAVIATGTRLYVPDLDGLVMPGRPPWGGFVHDGCLVADDRGGAIDGQQLDFFVGQRALYKIVDKDLHSPTVRVYDGGRAVPVTVPITRPDLGDAEVAAAARVLRSGWIMMGPEVAAFEAELAAYLGAPHVVAVANGTLALELALRALDIGPGDEVVTVSHSFIATANAVVAVGATPVFVDVEEDTLGMDPARAAAAMGPRVKAVLPVHQVGIPCRLTDFGVPIIEDAACAIGSALAPPRGILACYSFHPRKILTTGEGGAIATADAALAARLRRLRAHALEDGRFVEPATNARLTDIQAAIGRVQLAKLDAALAERRRIAARYDQALSRSPLLAPASVRAGSNWQSYPARVRHGTADEVVAVLAARGVQARGGLTNAHEEPAYAGRGRIAGSLAMSEQLRRGIVMLPIFQGLRADEEAVVLAALQGPLPARTVSPSRK